MAITGAITQLRTTDLEASIAFYTEKLGLTVAFRYQDFYAGIRAGDSYFHLKHADAVDPSIADVTQGDHFHLYLTTDDVEAAAAKVRACGGSLLKDVHDTPWGTREFALADDQGHTIYVGGNR